MPACPRWMWKRQAAVLWNLPGLVMVLGGELPLDSVAGRGLGGMAGLFRQATPNDRL